MFTPNMLRLKNTTRRKMFTPNMLRLKNMTRRKSLFSTLCWNASAELKTNSCVDADSWIFINARPAYVMMQPALQITDKCFTTIQLGACSMRRNRKRRSPQAVYVYCIPIIGFISFFISWTCSDKGRNSDVLKNGLSALLRAPRSFLGRE